MNFFLLHAQLLEVVRQRVRNGDLTERSLARLTGVSQPHIHNVLKGVRTLSNHLADEILLQLKLDVAALTGNSQKEFSAIRNIPLMAGLLGQEAGTFDAGRTMGAICLPALVTAKAWHPVAARLGRDDEACPRFEAGDIVLIDQAVCFRADLRTDAVYAVETRLGVRLRYLRQSGERLFVASESSRHAPRYWEILEVDAVRGRVIWVSRSFEWR